METTSKVPRTPSRASTNALGKRSGGGGGFLQKLRTSAKAQSPRAELTHHLRCSAKRRSRNTRLGICLKMPHTPAQLRRAAEHSAGPPKNSAPCVTKIPPQRRGCNTAPPGKLQPRDNEVATEPGAPFIETDSIYR